MKVRICLEVQGFALDENNNPCPAGVEISLGETTHDIDYEHLTKNLSIPTLLNLLLLDKHVRPEDVKIITPEEYDLKYRDKTN